MAFNTHRIVSFSEIVEYLSSTSPNNIASPLGGMLEKLKNGVYFVNRPTENNEELKLLSKSSVLKCIDELKKVEKVDFENVPELRFFCRGNKIVEGPLVLAVVGAYHRWSTKSEQRGLVEVYRLLQTLDDKLPDPDIEEEELVQSFRLGKGKIIKARDLSSKILADSELALHTFVQVYNKRAKRRKEF